MAVVEAKQNETVSTGNPTVDPIPEPDPIANATPDLSKIETDIAADFAKMSGFSTEVNRADESYEYFVPNRGMQAAKAAAAGALGAVALVCAVGLVAVRSTKGRALVTLFLHPHPHRVILGSD